MMAIKIAVLPKQIRHRSKYHDLFTQISDGTPWKIAKTEFNTTPTMFRLALQGWMRQRNLAATTRTDDEGNLYVQVFKPQD
jgi:hypothetical protein